MHFNVYMVIVFIRGSFRFCKGIKVKVIIYSLYIIKYRYSIVAWYLPLVPYTLLTGVILKTKGQRSPPLLTLDSLHRCPHLPPKGETGPTHGAYERSQMCSSPPHLDAGKEQDTYRFVIIEKREFLTVISNFQKTMCPVCELVHLDIEKDWTYWVSTHLYYSGM